MPTLKDILTAPKVVTGPHVMKAKSPPTQMDADFDLDTLVPGMKGKLILYARVNTLLPESFSLGLRLEGGRKQRTSLLIRLNGWHGPHPNPDGSVIPRHTAHIHVPTDQELAGDYAGKVKLQTAVELQPMMQTLLPGPPALTDVWPFFAKYVNIQPDASVDAVLTQLCGATSQQSLGMI